VAIILQSTVGGFSAEFLRRLPELEQAMVAHGLEPSQFVISKDRATPATVPVIGSFFHDYGVRRRREFHRHRAGRHQIPGVLLPALHRGGRGHAGTTKTERRPHQPHLPLDGTADLIGG
jgi:hypothetical protein